jgi:hypothetical protein
MQLEEEYQIKTRKDFLGQLLNKRRHVCNIRISLRISKIIEESSVRIKEQLLHFIKSKRDSEKCCKTCGSVQWIDHDEHNRGVNKELVAVTITEKEYGWVQIVTDPIST